MKISQDVYLIGSGKLGLDWTHPADSNVYAVDTGGSVVLIDAGTGMSVPLMVEHLRAHELDPGRVSLLLLTHLHADHAGGAALWKERTDARIGVAAAAVRVLEGAIAEEIDLPKAQAAGFYPADYKFRRCSADLPLQDGETLREGRYKVTALHTPGHSKFDMCYLFDDGSKNPFLFSGDTVFYGGKISMLSTHDFNLNTLSSSMERLSELGFGMLLPGHGQPALANGPDHIRSAHDTFVRLGVPQNIG